MIGNVIFANGCGQWTGRTLFVYSDADFETLDGTLRGNFEVAWLVSAKMYLNALATVYP